MKSEVKREIAEIQRDLNIQAGKIYKLQRALAYSSIPQQADIMQETKAAFKEQLKLWERYLVLLNELR